MNKQFRINKALYCRYLEAIKDRENTDFSPPAQIQKTVRAQPKPPFNLWIQFIKRTYQKQNKP